MTVQQPEAGSAEVVPYRQAPELLTRHASKRAIKRRTQQQSYNIGLAQVKALVPMKQDRIGKVMNVF